jgi:ubiquinone/menaquinone biosynthesis C-methylase UbiE
MKQAWEYIGQDADVAFLMMSNSKDEASLQTSGRRDAEWLRQSLRIESQHQVLEVGCGVARIGRELAPSCAEWWGCDISSSIIRIARRRTAHLNNVHFQVLDDCSLRGFADNSFDRVYCHAVFMHMDQGDVFAYVQEMQRVVKPRGVVFYNAIDLTGAEGWARFVWEMEHYRGRQARPIHHSRFTTPQELTLYTQQAGLGLLNCQTSRLWVQVVATKYPDDCHSDQERQRCLEQVRMQVDPQALAGT